MALFDTYVMVDWSASIEKSKKPKKDAIWWAAVQHGLESCAVYETTRRSAVRRITSFVSEEIASGRRVLLGFDFAFGYPRGLSRILTGEDSARSVWRWLSNRIVDDDSNGNNRYAVAGELNRTIVANVNERIASGDSCVTDGPFWGFPEGSERRDHKPTKDPYRESRRKDEEEQVWPHQDWPPVFGFGRKRVTEGRAPSAKSVFQLSGAGSVGSQVLMGVPWVQYLQRRLGSHGLDSQCLVWPFDTRLTKRPKKGGAGVVVLEIYPSLIEKEIDEYVKSDKGKGEIKDRAQVRLNSLVFARLDQEGRLGNLFRPHVSKADRKGVEEEEGWIFGVGFEAELREALERVLAER